MVVTAARTGASPDRNSLDGDADEVAVNSDLKKQLQKRLDIELKVRLFTNKYFCSVLAQVQADKTPQTQFMYL